MTLKPIFGRNHTIWIADDQWVALGRQARHQGVAIYELVSDMVDQGLRGMLGDLGPLTEEAVRVAENSPALPKRAEPKATGTFDRRSTKEQRDLMIKKYGKDSPMVKALDE